MPMSQEARGLDAGKRLAERLVGAGDARSASIVAAIATEERAHVAVGECSLDEQMPIFKESTPWWLRLKLKTGIQMLATEERAHVAVVESLLT